MLIRLENHYFNLDNVADVVDNGDHIMVRFNFINPSTQGPQAIRVSGNQAQQLRAVLDGIFQSSRGGGEAG